VSEFLDSLVAGEPLLPRRSDPAIERESKARTGMVSEMLRYVMPSPWMADAVMTRLPRSYASADDLTLAEFTASQENACRHCYGAMRSVLRLLGYGEAQILRLERDRQAAEMDSRGRAIVDFARALARSNPRPGRADLEALRRAGFTRDETTELAVAVAFACFANRIGSFLAIPPDSKLEAMPSSLLVRMMGPLVRRKLRGKPLPPPAAPLPPPEVPFGAIVPLLGAIPGAAFVGGMLEGAFRSEALPRRARTLVFAVVARTLGCALCEAESGRALVAAGIDAPEGERILGHLASPRLDPLEALLVPWARETVRYRPAAIQDRTRKLLAAIGPDRTLEAVGTAALANAVVRLGALAE
jgi:alkylhydroperoxidase family enzyme